MTQWQKILLGLMGCLISVHTLAANLLVNGDFTQTDPTNPDTVTPPGWRNVGTANAPQEEGVIPNAMFKTPAYKRAGQADTVNFYDFGGFGRGYSQAGAGIAQAFTTVVGREYRLTFAMNSEASCSDDDGEVQMKITAGSLNETVNVPYPLTERCSLGQFTTDDFRRAWVVKTFTFKATSTSTDLKFVTTKDSDRGSNDPMITGVEVVDISPQLTVTKALGGLGRLNTADQFTVQIKDTDGNVVNSTTASTTTGSSAAVTAGTGTTGVTTLVPGNSYTLTEVMATDSPSALSAYSATVSCSNSTAGGTSVSGITRLGQALVLAANDVVSCTLTNSPAQAGGISGRVFVDDGRSAGVANDGIANGGESPLAGVSVQLTNCSGTVHGQTLTDGQGAYSFKAPNVAAGAALCVVQANAATYLSTGVSVGSTAVPSGTPVSVSGVSYTYVRSSDTLSFTWNGSGHADLNFGDVPASTWVAGGSKTVAPGTTATYAHTFTAGTAGTVVFSIASSTATPAIQGWSERIFLDPDCTGSLPAGATQVYPPLGAGISVSAQQKVCVIVQAYVPATAQVGHRNEASVQAALSLSNASPALSASYSVNDVTLVDNVSLNLFKEVRNVTQNGAFGANNQAKSGDVLEYRITYTNMTPAVLTNLTVNDTTPAFTSFVSSLAGSTPATLTACTKTTPANPGSAVACSTSQSAGGTGAVVWRFTGSLPGSGSGQVLFQVKVD